MLRLQEERETVPPSLFYSLPESVSERDPPLSYSLPSRLSITQGRAYAVPLLEGGFYLTANKDTKTIAFGHWVQSYIPMSDMVKS